jgi:hypothetical protein
MLEEERERKAATKIQAIARGWLGRRNYKNLSMLSSSIYCVITTYPFNSPEGRTIVAKELHTTERDYLSFLSSIINV